MLKNTIFLKRAIQFSLGYKCMTLINTWNSIKKIILYIFCIFIIVTPPKILYYCKNKYKNVLVYNVLKGVRERNNATQQKSSIAKYIFCYIHLYMHTYYRLYHRHSHSTILIHEPIHFLFLSNMFSNDIKRKKTK